MFVRGNGADSAPGSSGSSPFRAAAPRKHAAQRSPPLAFEPTPNDSLAPPFSPTDHPSLDLNSYTPPSVLGMDGFDAVLDGGTHAQNIIDKQANAIQALHVAFAAERDAWRCERDRLHQRIHSLEKLLKAQNGHSPAKSPITSPGSGLASPHSRAVSAATRLPSIAEDENIQPLSQRRENAPCSIDIPVFASEQAPPPNDRLRRTSVAFPDSAAAQLDELSVSPPRSATKISPPPLESLAMAGHTPLKLADRPQTPPPRVMMLDGIEDTPTRNNTHINTFLTRSHDEEEDKELEGPLNMPELPSQPGENNFTQDMLFKRLEQIASDPETNRPLVFAMPSPGLAVPDAPEGILALDPSPNVAELTSESPAAPVSTQDQLSSSRPSPDTTAPDTISPHTIPLSEQSSKEAVGHIHRLEQGGIRLKKKPSSNFGAPFGQLGGLRRFS